MVETMYSSLNHYSTKDIAGSLWIVWPIDGFSMELGMLLTFLGLSFSPCLTTMSTFCLNHHAVMLAMSRGIISFFFLFSFKLSEHNLTSMNSVLKDQMLALWRVYISFVYKES